LYALLEKAADVLEAWVDDLQTKGNSERTGLALIAAADRVKNGEPFRYAENEQATAAVESSVEFDAPQADVSAEMQSGFATDDNPEEEVPAAVAEAEEVELSDEEL